MTSSYGDGKGLLRRPVPSSTKAGSRMRQLGTSVFVGCTVA